MRGLTRSEEHGARPWYRLQNAPCRDQLRPPQLSWLGYLPSSKAGTAACTLGASRDVLVRWRRNGHAGVVIRPIPTVQPMLTARLIWLLVMLAAALSPFFGEPDE